MPLLDRVRRYLPQKAVIYGGDGGIPVGPALRDEKKTKHRLTLNYGGMYWILGANKEALEALENSIGQEPDYYRKMPDVYRSGEAEFALGYIEKAKEHLLRYVNAQESAPDQDMVLAKLAEIFLSQGDWRLQKRCMLLSRNIILVRKVTWFAGFARAEFMEKYNSEQCCRDL